MEHQITRTDSTNSASNKRQHDVEGKHVLNSNYDDKAMADVDPAFERATMRKVDLRLLLILGGLYSISLIDRTNLSLARVAGMSADLRLFIGERYSIVNLVFFIPYIIFELPSNILIRKVGTRNLLSAIAVCWGAVMIGMGFVKTYEQLAVLRTLLGFFEAGFFPGCVFLIQTWYTRYETQKRLAVFYLLSMVVAGFSAILAYGLTTLNGAHGIRGWRWIFIVEGAITVGLGLIAWLLIVDFPDKNKFLTEEQTKLVVARVNRDRGDALPDQLTLHKALTHLKDWTLWAHALCFMSSTLPAYAFSFFLPVILFGSGYSPVLSQCLSAPPYVAAAIWTFAIAYAADKTRVRAPFMALNALVCIIGLMITGYADTRGVRYFGSYFALMGAQANVPSVLAYNSNNVTSHSKRACSSALVIGFGGIGGIFASTVYRQADYPLYRNGLWATFGCQLLIIALVTATSLHYKRQNKLLAEGKRGLIEGTEGFRYTM